MLIWDAVSNVAALSPDQDYDRAGVFTGCWVPRQHPDDSELRVVYSSVRRLPFHWSTPPYPKHAVGVSMARSKDGGLTWQKSSQNPVLHGELTGLQVTGFRDPFVSQWSAMDDALGKDSPALYAVVSGGIQDRGPTSFLYEVDTDRAMVWKYLGPLVDMPLRFEPSKKWSGNFGVNWECVNFMTLRFGAESRHFLIIGVEGDVEKDHVKNHPRADKCPERTVRAQLWMSGHLIHENGIVRFKYDSGGYLDNGSYYAANSFVDPPSGRRIVHGWIPEEDVPSGFTREKGWNGALALPRELFLLRIHNVQSALRSSLPSLTNFERIIQDNSLTTLTTLGIRPIHEMKRLRGSCVRMLKTGSAMTLFQTDESAHHGLFEVDMPTWELETTIVLQPGCEVFGLDIQPDRERPEHTSITFSVKDEVITVDRSASTENTEVNTCLDAGPFTLFTTCDQGDPSKKSLEKLRLRLFADGDILEVYANDRFALATMVYSDAGGQGTGLISAFAHGTQACATLKSAELWMGLDPRRKLYR